MSKRNGVERPLALWVVLAMSLVVSVYLIPVDRIHGWFLPVYLVLCGLILWGLWAGARWVFVLNVLTVWIFPFETWVGIKKWPAGVILSGLHVVGVVVLVAGCWAYFWGRGKGGVGVERG